MGTITATVPKALIDVAGRPFLEHQLHLLQTNGVHRVVVCVGHLGEQIEATVRSCTPPGMQVKVQFDGPRLLGTGGAIRAALPLLDESFFVLYGDSYLTCNFGRVQQAFEASGKLGLMTVFRNEGKFDRSNVQFESGQLIAYDKRVPTPRMHHIDYGLGVLSRAAVETLTPGAKADLAVLYADLLARQQLAGYAVAERFYEIGSPGGLAETRAFLAAQVAGSAMRANV
jgi:NDP-sugar pyrophosphorylase family protein